MEVPQILHFKGIFHYKTFFWGYPPFRYPPSFSKAIQSICHPSCYDSYLVLQPSPLENASGICVRKKATKISGVQGIWWHALKLWHTNKDAHNTDTYVTCIYVYRCTPHVHTIENILIYSHLRISYTIKVPYNLHSKWFLFWTSLFWTGRPFTPFTMIQGALHHVVRMFVFGEPIAGFHNGLQHLRNAQRLASADELYKEKTLEIHQTWRCFLENHNKWWVFPCPVWLPDFDVPRKYDTWNSRSYIQGCRHGSCSCSPSNKCSSNIGVHSSLVSYNPRHKTNCCLACYAVELRTKMSSRYFRCNILQQCGLEPPSGRRLV